MRAKFKSENLKAWDQLGDLDVDGRITLKWNIQD